MSLLNFGHERAPLPINPIDFGSVSIETIVAWMGAAASGDVSAWEHLQQLKDHYSTEKNQVCVS